MFSSLNRQSFLAKSGSVLGALAVLLLVAWPGSTSAGPLTAPTADADHSAAGLKNGPGKPSPDAAAVQPPDNVLEVVGRSGADFDIRSGISAAASQTDQSTSPTVVGRDMLQWPGSGTGPEETLGQMLRTIVTIDRDYSLSTSRGGAGRGPGSLGLAQVVLDSDTPVALLRQVVDIKSTDGRVTVFSILGLGDFVLELSPGEHSWTISEMSTGLSVGVPSSSGEAGPVNRDTPSYDDSAASDNDAAITVGPPRHGLGLFQIIKWMREFITSSLGMLCILMASLFALLWLAAKTMMALERRPSGR